MGITSRFAGPYAQFVGDDSLRRCLASPTALPAIAWHPLRRDGSVRFRRERSPPGRRCASRCQTSFQEGFFCATVSHMLGQQAQWKPKMGDDLRRKALVLVARPTFEVLILSKMGGNRPFFFYSSSRCDGRRPRRASRPFIAGPPFREVEQQEMLTLRHLGTGIEFVAAIR